jgi:hypothetical protein
VPYVGFAGNVGGADTLVHVTDVLRGAPAGVTLAGRT